jgi:hypothetical protein
MKKIILGVLLLAALLIFGFIPPTIGPAQANPVLAQVAQPSPPPQSQETPAPSKPAEPSDNQAKPEESKPSETAKAQKSKEESPGPYDMEAIKAFNRALYGS